MPMVRGIDGQMYPGQGPGPRYILAWGDTLQDLMTVVDDTLNEKPVMEPIGGSFYADARWNQAIFWKESGD